MTQPPRGFGPGVPGQYLTHVHEYEPRRIRYSSASRRNAAGAPLVSGDLLAVDGNSAIDWEQISGAERRRRYVAAGRGVPGEPDYVAQVLAQP